jgi:hypothetical protein
MGARKAMMTGPFRGIWICFALTIMHETMRERTILPGEAGVLYRSKSAGVLWAFEDLRLPLRHEQRVLDVLSGETFRVREEFHAARHRVYLMGIEVAPAAGGKFLEPHLLGAGGQQEFEIL